MTSLKADISEWLTSILLRQALFVREVSILKACCNKNIVAFLGQFVQDQRTWLIMEYMEVRRNETEPKHGGSTEYLQFAPRPFLCAVAV